jgi:phosphatidate cytidylyltransferase
VTEATQRIITSVIAAPVAVGLAYLGGWAFGGLVLLIALAAQYELYAMADAVGAPAHRVLGALLGGVLATAALWSGAGTVAVVLVIGLAVGSPFLFEREHLIPGLAATLLGAAFPAGLIGFLAALREARGPEVGSLEAFYLVLTTFLLVWATDIFAYYTGKSIGRRALAPTISPNKTWEGTLGGAAAAGVIAIGCKWALLPVLSWIDVVALAVIGGGISQLGDLAESAMKRSSNVKDSSSLIPGHGGVFDRFDSMTIAAPLIYLYLRHIAGIIG